MRKSIFSAAIGICGGIFTSCVGEWTAGLKALFIFIAADFLTGLLLSAVFKKSPKTDNGGLSSRTAFKGICQKVFLVVLVGLCHQLDLVLEVSYLRDACVFAFLASELISIVENAGLMGLPIPQLLRDAIDILNKKNKDSSIENIIDFKQFRKK